MATRIWLGNAVAIKDKWTITIANTWAAGDTCTITINGNDLVITIGTLVTTAQVATTIKQAWQNEAFTDTTASANVASGGQGIPEHKLLTATVSGSVVTLTANTAGVPFTVSVAENTVGTGTATGAHSVTATGPNYWDNVDNWSGGAVPANTDSVYIDSGNVDILYGLDQSAVTLTLLQISKRYSGKIGLPDRNSGGYAEYRDKYLKIGATTINVGTDQGSGSGRIKLNVGSVQTALTVYGTATGAETGIPALLFVGTHASNTVTVAGGDVGIAVLSGETATVATLRQTGGTVSCGSGVTLTTIAKLDGTLTTNSAATTVTNDGGTLTLNAGAHTTLTMNGGTLNYNGTGTVTTLTLNNGSVADFEGSNQAVTVTNCTLNDASSIRDFADRVTFTNPITWKGKLTLAQ